MPAKKPLHAYFLTWEGWGDSSDFAFIEPEVVAEYGADQGIFTWDDFLNDVIGTDETQFRSMAEAASGHDVRDQCFNHDLPLYVYELRLVATFSPDEEPPPEPPKPERKWSRVRGRKR